MARSPTARVELSKKSYLEVMQSLLALVALLKAAGQKAGFTIPDQDEETDEEVDEDADEEEEETSSNKSKGKKSKKDEEDEESEDEEDEDEESDEEDESEDEESDEEDESEDDEDEEEDDADALSPANLKKVKAALQDVLDVAGRKAAVALLTKYKVEKVSDLDDSQASLFIVAAKRAVDEASKDKSKDKSKGKKKK